MLRSFAYVTSAVAAPARPARPGGLRAAGARAFLERYFAAVDRRCCPPARPAIDNLLSIFELEKAIYELRYELDNRPDWVPIPVAGIGRLLDGAGVSAVATERARARSSAASTPTRTRVLGAHPADGGVVDPRLRPGARARSRRAATDGEAESSSSRSTPAGMFEGAIEGAELPLRYRLEVDYGDGRHVHDRRSVRVPADARRARPAPDRRGPPRAALRAARRALREHRRASPAPPSRSGRRPRARSASSATSTPGTAGCTRCARSARAGSGSCSCPASAPARATSTRSSRRRRAAAEGRPVRARDRGAAADGVGRARAAPRLERGRASGCARAGSSSRSRRPISIYEVHLGSWRLNPLEGNRSLDLPRAGRRAGRVRAATSASPTSSCCR